MKRKLVLDSVAVDLAQDGEVPDFDGAESLVFLRPDGYYWQAVDGKQEFGPFASREAAYADMQLGDSQYLVPGESLEDAESEIGIADWIDPETGDPAEGMAPPHLESD